MSGIADMPPFQGLGLLKFIEIYRDDVALLYLFLIQIEKLKTIITYFI